VEVDGTRTFQEVNVINSYTFLCVYLIVLFRVCAWKASKVIGNPMIYNMEFY